MQVQNCFHFQKNNPENSRYCSYAFERIRAESDFAVYISLLSWRVWRVTVSPVTRWPDISMYRKLMAHLTVTYWYLLQNGFSSLWARLKNWQASKGESGFLWDELSCGRSSRLFQSSCDASSVPMGKVQFIRRNADQFGRIIVEVLSFRCLSEAIGSFKNFAAILPKVL